MVRLGITPVMKMVMTLVIASLLSACATQGPSRLELEQIYLRHAGPEAQRIRYSGVIRGWQPIGDEYVLLELGASRHVLLGLSAPCHLELRSADHLAIRSLTGLSIDRFDRVSLGGVECRIMSLRPVDYAAAREEIEALYRQTEEDGAARRVSVDVEDDDGS